MSKINECQFNHGFIYHQSDKSKKEGKETRSSHSRHSKHIRLIYYMAILLDFLLTVKAATLIFISGCGLAISSAKEGISGFIYDLVKS